MASHSPNSAKPKPVPVYYGTPSTKTPMGLVGALLIVAAVLLVLFILVTIFG